MREHLSFSIRLILLSLFVFCGKVLFSQQTNDFRSNFDQAEGFMYVSAYGQALEKWKSCYQADSLNANVNFKLGYTYLLMAGEKHKAAQHLELASKQISKKYAEFSYAEKNAPGYTFYWLGMAYHLNYELDKAENAYKTYKEKYAKGKEEKQEADRQLKMIENTRVLQKKPITATITNLGDSINTSFPEFSPVVSADESVLLYTSKRDNTTGEQQDEDGTFHEDVCISERINGKWSLSKHISDHINITGNESVVGLSADGQQLFLYRKSEKDHGDLYTSTLDGDEWSFPKRLGPTINTEEFNESSASLSADGQTLYFVSDRSGGVGGKDIYYATKQADGGWGAAVNAGNSINTEYNEECVYVHPDNRNIYFSSDNNNSMGGFDILVSEKNDDGTFSSPQNRGYPINTSDDDWHYGASADGKRIYVTSGIRSINTKEQTRGDKDLFLLNLTEVPSSKLTLMKGTIYPSFDSLDLSKINITLYDESGNKIIPSEIRVNKKSGKFLAFFPQGINYKISYDLGKYGKGYDTVMSANEKMYREIIKDIDLAEPNPFAPRWKKVLAQNDVFDVNKNIPLRLPVLKNDECVAASLVPESFQLLKQPQYGKVSSDSLGAITYSPNNDYVGSDSFSYSVKNNKNIVSNEAMVSLNVIGEGDKTYLYYEKYFEYKINHIEDSRAWKKFVDDVLKEIKDSGIVYLKIESSASKVPIAQGSNESLAEKRATDALQKLKTSIIKQKGDWSKVKVSPLSSIVQGPEYTGNGKDKSKYAIYQYVKIRRE